jgi:hypothetical protein
MVRSLQGARPLARLTTLVGIFASAFSPAAPSAADLARCAGLEDPAARLACYDAISGHKAAGKGPAASPAVPSGAVAASSTLPAPAAPAIAAPPAPAIAAPFSSDPKNFGFTEAQRAPASSQSAPKAIEARIAKINEPRWGPASAVLDNGQTWVFVDDEQDANLRPQDPITIKRGALGSFLLITPSKHSYHVRRTQ